MLSLPLAALEAPEDRAAFLRFYDAHAQGLLRCARSLLREPALAEEAVQEAWLRCIRSAATFLALPEEERLPWMAVVVRNAAFTLRRKELRHQPIPDGWDAPAPDRHGAADIVAVIRAMPEAYRTVLELKLVQEWSDRAIARALDLPLSTVTSRIQRGRQRLRAALLEEGYEP